MLQEAIAALVQEWAHIGPNHSQCSQKLSVSPVNFIRGNQATLRQISLGKEIKHTTAEAATANQLPQSGIQRETSHSNPQHNWWSIVLSDWNHGLKHARWQTAYGSSQPATHLTIPIMSLFN